MTNKNTKYDTLIARLRDAKPVVPDADMLTDEIMLAISKQNKNTSYRVLNWFRPFMTAAAMFLLGLFLYQQLENTGSVQQVTAANYDKHILKKTLNCTLDSKMNLTEKRKLLNQYICYMKINRTENENLKLFYLKYLPKDQADIFQ